jgi:predicted anti-sigma-YlaC factor YlaD
MRQIGSYLFLTGLLAIILDFVNMVPRVLMWIYTWGDATAWAIKIGVMALGAILWFLGKKK